MPDTTWKPCRKCGAVTRHDDGVCIRDTRHPGAAALQRAYPTTRLHTLGVHEWVQLDMDDDPPSDLQAAPDTDNPDWQVNL